MSNIFTELKRRNVFRVAVAYTVISWLLIQVADILTPALRLPESLISAITLILLLGFIPALLFSWAYEITPEGIKKESDVDRAHSVTGHTAKKLDIITLFSVIGLAGLIIWQQMAPQKIQSDSVTEAPVNNEPASSVPVTNPPEMVEVTAHDKTTETLNKPAKVISNKSIAVLPFTNMANDPKNEPFTLGLHDDLLTHLSKISALKVISRTSVMEYKNTTKKIKDIADELGVANILEGGVQKAGNQMRLNVQLIDANTDEHLWAEIYDRELTTENIFKIQTEVSEHIAAALKAQLTEQESKSLAKIPTNNLQAYNNYLAGQQLLEKRTGPALKEALALYERAASLDPNYTQAYVGQAIALRLLNEYSDMSVSESQKRSAPLLAKALELDPLSAMAHLANASYLDEKQEYKKAEEAYKHSISLNPNIAQAYHWYGHMLRVDLGRAQEALTMHRKAAELDPLSSVILANVGWSLRSNGHNEEALLKFEKVHQTDSKYPGSFNGLAWLNDDVGNYARAIIEQTKAVNLDKGNILNRTWLFFHYMSIGDTDSAKAVLGESKNISPSYMSLPSQESLLDMIAGEYLSAQNRIQEFVTKYPNNLSYKVYLARYSAVNNNCTLSAEVSKDINPEKFAIDYQSNSSVIYQDLILAWCLKQTEEFATYEQLITSISKIVKDAPMRLDGFFHKVGLLAVQDKPTEAAKAYAEVIDSNRTRGWYWIDHLPLYDEMRKEPVFIQAHEQLMKNLAEQRELLKQLTTTENTP